MERINPNSDTIATVDFGTGFPKGDEDSVNRDGSDDNLSDDDTDATDLVSDTRPFLYLVSEKCRAFFQRPHNQNVKRVCGKEGLCNQEGHRKSDASCGGVGFYRQEEPISTRSPPDGDQDTYLSRDQYETLYDQWRQSNQNAYVAMATPSKPTDSQEEASPDS
jgi:hypothetical protein